VHPRIKVHFVQAKRLPYDHKRGWGVVVLREAAGIVFMAHGCQKVFVFTMFAPNVALAGPGAAALDHLICKGGA